MSIYTILLSLLLITLNGVAQTADSFSDGDFANNPAWTGNPSEWIVNPNLQLQSNNNQSNTSFYLSTPSTAMAGFQWEWFTLLDFNPSSANYADVFLTASAADPTAAGTTGYFVRMGGTEDELALYRKDPGGTIIKIIDGQNNTLNNSSNRFRVKVICTITNQWILQRDLTATGNNYISEGVVTDATYTSGAFFCFAIRQSTTTFFRRHFFDDLLISPYQADLSPPALVSLFAIGPRQLDCLFDEALSLSSSQQVLHYTADCGLGYPVSAVRDPANPALVHLLFSNPFPTDTLCRLTLYNIEDLWQNTMPLASRSFVYHPVQRYDIVISELMPDPSPPVSLPASEWIELTNCSPYPINLAGWTIRTLTSTTASFPILILPPDSAIALCTTSAVPALQVWGNTIGLAGFPVLDNDQGALRLCDATGKTIHQLQYTNAWYSNTVKANGGWSLEMTDLKNPCTGMSNWKASAHPAGGTPGRKNSNSAPNPDSLPPQLLAAYATDSLHLILVFEEPLDSSSATRVEAYNIDGGIGHPDSVRLSPFFEQAELHLQMPIVANKKYGITARNIRDCAGNLLKEATAAGGKAVAVGAKDLILNELLFNPKSGGTDYLEYYNRSTKIIDLQALYLAGRDRTGQLTVPAPLTTTNRLLFPGQYIVCTAAPELVKQQYLCRDTTVMIRIPNMPALPDDEGTIVLLDANGLIIDELHYSEDWHFQLISNREGVALERIDPNGNTQAATNWYSAATYCGYGTPTYANSQYRRQAISTATWSTNTDVFSPDQDGRDDQVLLQYRFPDNGFVASITIFDFAGRPVRQLRRNAICGATGSFAWDGLDNRHMPLPQGAYIVYVESFHPDGRREQEKMTVILTRRR